MQKFFSKFPDGGAGFGLLLLRMALGVMTIAQGGFSLFEQENLPVRSQALGLFAFVTGAALLLGFLTPFFCFVFFLESVISIFPISQSLNSCLSSVCVMAVSIATILLGPGAFSLDARLFGRREIIIPDRAPKS